MSLLLAVPCIILIIQSKSILETCRWANYSKKERRWKRKQKCKLRNQNYLWRDKGKFPCALKLRRQYSIYLNNSRMYRFVSNTKTVCTQKPGKLRYLYHMFAVSKPSPFFSSFFFTVIKKLFCSFSWSISRTIFFNLTLSFIWSDAVHCSSLGFCLLIFRTLSKLNRN